jgi:hypothetical protein
MHFKCLGISNFHIIAYNDTYVRLILQRVKNVVCIAWFNFLYANAEWHESIFR